MKLYKYIVRGSIIICLMLIIPLITFSSAKADTVGPKNPGIGSNMTGVGTESWTTPEEITTPGSPYATVTVYQDHRYSNYLLGNQYGFEIPVNASITGIEVSINRMSNSHNPNIVDNVVSLVRAGEIVGENKAAIDIAWPTELGVATYGGPADSWGIDWTSSDINSPDFGVVLAVYRDNNGSKARDGSVDSMQITVYYAFSSTTNLECGDGSSITYGESVTCTATVTKLMGDLTPSGEVSWASNESGSFNPNPCTLTGSNGTATCSAVYTPSAVGSGSHVITATYEGDDYFRGSSASLTVTVLKRPVTVTADPLSKRLGEVDPPLTYHYPEGTLVFGDTFSGGLQREPGENLGTYRILQGSLSLPPSYDITFIEGTFTITNWFMWLTEIFR